MDNLEALFHKEMLSLHEKWRSECNYNATVFIKIVKQHGGVKAAQILLRGQGLSRGFLKLMAMCISWNVPTGRFILAGR